MFVLFISPVSYCAFAGSQLKNILTYLLTYLDTLKCCKSTLYRFEMRYLLVASKHEFVTLVQRWDLFKIIINLFKGQYSSYN